MVALAIARKFSWDIQITEAAILNLQGLSTQVPGRLVYDSSGPNRVFNIGKCTIEFRKRRLSKTKELTTNINLYLRRTYGISIDVYDKILKDQNKCCAICSIHQGDLKQKLATDHDHKTGQVRGLLCSKCNMGLGSFCDSIENLTNAIKYLSSRAPCTKQLES